MGARYAQLGRSAGWPKKGKSVLLHGIEDGCSRQEGGFEKVWIGMRNADGALMQKALLDPSLGAACDFALPQHDIENGRLGHTEVTAGFIEGCWLFLKKVRIGVF